MRCPRCGLPAGFHDGQAFKIPRNIIREGGRPEGYFARIVDCVMISCEGVYIGACQFQAAGRMGADNVFHADSTLIPIAAMARIFAEANQQFPRTLQLRPRGEDPDHQTEPKPDPGE